MPKKIKYVYGGHGFASKKEVSDHANALRKQFDGKGDILDPTAKAFLLDLLCGQPEKAQKIGLGVDAFYVDESPDFPTSCFWIRRMNGTKTDFGIVSCINSIETLNKISLRQSISSITEKYRRKALANATSTFQSEYSGNTFPLEDAVVNSEPPFEDIVQSFFKSKGVDIETILLTIPVDANSIPKWKDTNLINEFILEFSRAKLRLVGRSEALSEIKIQANQTRKAAKP